MDAREVTDGRAVAGGIYSTVVHTEEDHRYTEPPLSLIGMFVDQDSADKAIEAVGSENIQSAVRTLWGIYE